MVNKKVGGADVKIAETADAKKAKAGGSELMAERAGVRAETVGGGGIAERAVGKEKAGKGAGYNVAPIICAIVVVVALMSVVVAVTTSGLRRNQDAGTATGDGTVTADGVEADYSVMTVMDSQGLLDFLADNDTGFVYLGRPTCPHCRVFAPILTKVVKADGLSVHYYDTDVANSDKDMKKKAMDAVEVYSVPTFMYIEDGVIVERLENTESEAVLREFVQKYQQVES